MFKFSLVNFDNLTQHKTNTQNCIHAFDSMQIVIPTRKTKAKHIIPNQTRPHSKPMTQIATQPWNVRKYHSNTHRQLHQLTATLSIVLADADNNWPQENDSENVLTHGMGSGGTDIIACTAFTKSTATHTHTNTTPEWKCYAMLVTPCTSRMRSFKTQYLLRLCASHRITDIRHSSGAGASELPTTVPMKIGSGPEGLRAHCLRG